MPKQFKPILAANFDPEKSKFPLYVTPKADGVRVLVREKDGVATAHSRTLKPIPNPQVNQALSKLPVGLDGELVLADSFYNSLDFNETQSYVMSRSQDIGDRVLKYYVFDYFGPEDSTVNLPYLDRLDKLSALVMPCDFRADGVSVRITLLNVPQKVYNASELEEAHLNYKLLGYEGSIARAGDGLYKYGRSTVNQSWLLRVKDWLDDEAVIVGCEEQLTHIGEATVSETGNSKRDRKQENLQPNGRLGAFVVTHPTIGQFKVGTGFTEAQRVAYWENRAHLIESGQHIKFKYFELGSKGKPRFPSFLGMRSTDDM